jgi:hypothetical protein
MAKILRQNVGGVDFTVAGCALTGVCPTAAADYVKQITLSDGDVIEDGMMMVVTFANGSSAGNAPGTKTIYSSDQVNYYEDAQLTVPFTLAPEGCYEIEYTGTANAYTYTDYPVFQVGAVSGPVCDYRGHITSGDLWEAGDSVQCMLKEGKFLLLGGSGGDDIDVYNSMAELIADLPNLQDGQFVATKDTGDELSQPVDTVEAGNLHAVTSNAVFLASSPNYANKQLIFDGITQYENRDYVAPDNGFLIASGWGTGQGNCYITFNINGVVAQNQANADESISVVMPVRKGDIVSINIYLASNNNGCYFVPCN